MSETIETIIQWHRETFPDATLEGQIEKFYKEQDEFNKAEPDSKEQLFEIADLFIVACGIARFSMHRAMDCFGVVQRNLIGTKFETETEFEPSYLDPVINEKMAINRKRQWNFNNGQYQHKELVE